VPEPITAPETCQTRGRQEVPTKRTFQLRAIGFGRDLELERFVQQKVEVGWNAARRQDLVDGHSSVKAILERARKAAKVKKRST
jgi:hypothetical protein